MTGRGNTQEETRDSQPEFPAQVRPPEEDAPNKEEDHSQTDIVRNNKQNSKGYAGDDANKVFRDEGEEDQLILLVADDISAHGNQQNVGTSNSLGW